MPRRRHRDQAHNIPSSTFEAPMASNRFKPSMKRFRHKYLQGSFASPEVRITQNAAHNSLEAAWRLWLIDCNHHQHHCDHQLDLTDDQAGAGRSMSGPMGATLSEALQQHLNLDDAANASAFAMAIYFAERELGSFSLDCKPEGESEEGHARASPTT